MPNELTVEKMLEMKVLLDEGSLLSEQPVVFFLAEDGEHVRVGTEGWVDKIPKKLREQLEVVIEEE